MAHTANRINYIDVIKGLAILIVVLAHVSEKYLVFEEYPLYDNVYASVYDISYAFHMHLFMLVSGFLYSKCYFAEIGMKLDRMKEQWINLFIVYVVFSIIVWVSKLLFSNSVLHPISVTDVLFIVIRPIGHLWYLHLLLLFYIINIPVMTCIITNKHIHVYLLLFFIFCIISNTPLLGKNMLLMRMMNYELFFFVGALWHRKEMYWLFDGRVIIGLFVIATIIAVFALPRLHEGEYSWWRGTIIALGWSLFIFFALKKITTKSFLFAEIGRKSLEIYLIHQFCVTAFQKLFPRAGLSNGLISLFLNFLLSVICVLVFSCMCKMFGIYNLLFRPYSFIKKEVSSTVK